MQLGSGSPPMLYKLVLGPNDLYLDWIGHSPCNDGCVFAMLNVRLQNHANLATTVTHCGAACIGGFEFLPLLHLHIYLSAHSIITKSNITPCNDKIKHVCINCEGLQCEYNLLTFILS